MFWVLVVVGDYFGVVVGWESRSTFGKLVPPEKSGEYFGFFEIFGKFAAVMGPALYALVKGLTGKSSFSILSIIALFVTGLVVLLVGRKSIKFRN